MNSERIESVDVKDYWCAKEEFSIKKLGCVFFFFYRTVLIRNAQAALLQNMLITKRSTMPCSKVVNISATCALFGA